MKQINLSVVVITFNEEKNLARCLASVKAIADEILVLDSGSTDKTCEIAKKNGARVVFRKFDNFANQKNYALENALGEWVFSIDADEEITAASAREIQSAVKNSGVSGYSMPRRNIIFGVEIKHTRWSPDRHVWLFRKNRAKWTGKIHEEVAVDGKVDELVNAKIHHSHATVFDFVAMTNKYTELEAEGRVGTGVSFVLLMLVLDPLISFFGRYVYKLGFLDGWRGFVLSYLRSFYKFVVWAKVWEKTHRA